MPIADSGWGKLPAPNSPLPFLGNDAMEKLVREFEFSSVLDVGCGAGLHAEHFRSSGKTVTTVDAGHYHDFKPDFLGLYENIKFNERFDCIWMCHILEHIRNVGSFLEKAYSDLTDDGILAVTVPPLKHDLVGGHINLFNPGTLIYHLIQAGFDCRNAAVKVYGYNISVIVKKTGADLEKGLWSFNEVTEMFPFPVKQNVDGRVLTANWYSY